LLVVFLEASSLEFLADKLLVTCARETLINEWDAQGTKISEWFHSLGYTGQEEERWWKIEIVVGRYQWVVSFMSCEWKMRDHLLLWITSLNLRVIFC
jgi:hypothetical protein